MAMRVAVLAAVLAATGGCVMPKYRKGEWPEGVPAESYYAQVYAADPRNGGKQSPEEYFDWVLRFFQGYGVVLGWQAQESTLAKMLPAEEYLVLSPQLAYLGQIVAGEWAKHNDVRRIDNEIIILWGNVLRRAAKEKKAGQAVDRLLQDAHAILANEIEKSAIKKERYEDLLPAKQ